MKKTLLTLLSLTLLALPATAKEDTIYAGIDRWTTPSDGSTYADFYLEPIPADFFCPGSASWSGRIPFGGEPLATLPEGALGNSDTILLRLDGATFDERGVATTRLQMQAMTLQGLETVTTSCGEYSVRTVLDGVQPVTEMQIVRTSDEGGHFLADVAVNVRMVFTPVNGRGQSVELSREILCAANPDHDWTSSTVQNGVSHKGSLVVDSNGDGQPDLPLPGTSNFTAGADPMAKTCGADVNLNPAAHFNPDHVHGTGC